MRARSGCNARRRSRRRSSWVPHRSRDRNRRRRRWHAPNAGDSGRSRGGSCVADSGVAAEWCPSVHHARNRNSRSHYAPEPSRDQVGLSPGCRPEEYDIAMLECAPSPPPLSRCAGEGRSSTASATIFSGHDVSPLARAFTSAAGARGASPAPSFSSSIPFPAEGRKRGGGEGAHSSIAMSYSSGRQPGESPTWSREGSGA